MPEEDLTPADGPKVIENADELALPDRDDGGKAAAPPMPSDADEVTGPDGDGD